MVKWIKFPIEILCCHEDGNVEMNMEVDDPQVPTYLATCLKCGKQIIIAFGDFLTEDAEKPTYKSLEQQIQELWESRGLKVLEETAEPIGEGKFKWTITAKRIQKTPLALQEEAKIRELEKHLQKQGYRLEQITHLKKRDNVTFANDKLKITVKLRKKITEIPTSKLLDACASQKHNK